MKRHYRIIFALILVIALSMLTVLSCSAFTNAEREGVAEWELGVLNLTDGINEYEPYTVNGKQVEFTSLGCELTNHIYYYRNTVELKGEEYDVCAAYDFAPVVFLESTELNENYCYSTYAYCKRNSDGAFALDNFLAGEYEKVRAICYDGWSPVAFDMSCELLQDIQSGYDCQSRIINMSELDTDWYELYGFDKTDILARYESFLFKNEDDWCYLDLSTLSPNYFYADGSLALDKDIDVKVTVIGGETDAALRQQATNQYNYEIVTETEGGENPFDDIFGSLLGEDGAIGTACVVVIILGIVAPVALGVYTAIDIFVLKKGKRNISGYVMAGAEALWLVSGIIFLIILLI